MKKREIRKLVYRSIIDALRREVLYDLDDPDFIDEAWKIQQQIANRLELKAA